MLFRIRRSGLLVLPAAAIILAACASELVSQESPAIRSGDSGEVLATIDGEPITVADLEEAVAEQLAVLEYQYGSQRYQLLQGGLDAALRDRLIAAHAEELGLDPEQVVEQELAGKIDISEEQVESWYAANQARLQGRALDALRPAIRQFLWEQARDEILGALTDRLSAERAVDVQLDPFRVHIETDGYPTLGPASAPITIVEFSDFECPYCSGFLDTLERVKQDYDGQIRLVYRQFPLRQIHPNADTAAQASLCAAEQGSFWELHDLMFAEQETLETADLADKAGRLGLDTAAFSSCLESGKYAEQVEADLRAGARLGINGTPAVFINGRPVEGGAVPYETLAQVIDDELERVGR